MVGCRAGEAGEHLFHRLLARDLKAGLAGTLTTLG